MAEAEYEVRKLPKKTIVYIVILVLLGIGGYFIITKSKEVKVEEILVKVGHTNVANVTVFGEHEFLNQETNIKGKQYSIKFTDTSNGKECRGFVFKDYKRNYMKDLECK